MDKKELASQSPAASDEPALSASYEEGKLTRRQALKRLGLTAGIWSLSGIGTIMVQQDAEANLNSQPDPAALVEAPSSSHSSSPSSSSASHSSSSSSSSASHSSSSSSSSASHSSSSSSSSNNSACSYYYSYPYS